jgi:hypothetical protein
LEQRYSRTNCQWSKNILEKNHSNRFRNESFKYQFKRSIRNTRAWRKELR